MDKTPQMPAANTAARDAKAQDEAPGQMTQAAPLSQKGRPAPASPQMGGQIFTDWASI